MRFINPTRVALTASWLVCLLLSACGGGSSDGDTNCTPGTAGCLSNPTQVPTPTPTPTPSVWDSANLSLIPASSTVANVCTASDEKHFVRAYLNENYLWYNEIQATPSEQAATVSDYFYSLLVTTPDGSGHPKDRFSFIVPINTAESISTGASIAYGVTWARDANGHQRVATVTPGSPAESAGLARGGLLDSVDSSNVDSWYPDSSGATVTFNYRDRPNAPSRVVSMEAVSLQESPVPLVSTIDRPGGGKLGYLLFTSHSSLAQDKLIDAMSLLRSQGVSDLVLDMRYNSGGFLYVAESLASMVVGPVAKGKVFERLQFNNKRADESAVYVYPFLTDVLFSDGGKYQQGDTLPALNLKRLYVLTTSATCSASESVINSLRGVDVDVVLIGDTTCGKPYGFTRRDNCGKALYPIEFQGFNEKGFGDYANGFAPTCAVQDDFDHVLGDPNEAMLAAALQHMSTGQCPAANSVSLQKVARMARPASVGLQLSDERPRFPGRLLTGH